MKYVVCTKYCGAVVEIEEFDLEEDAENFCRKPCVLFYADEVEGLDEDEVIQPCKMWIETKVENIAVEELPFTDFEDQTMLDYELPF